MCIRDRGSTIHEIYQLFARFSRLDFQPQENQMAIALVEKGLGITVLPGLTLIDLIPNQMCIRDRSRAH